MILLHLVAFLGCLLLSLVLTRSVRNLAVARGWVAEADSARHLHAQPLPRLGGVAIFLSFVASTALVLASAAWLNLDLGFESETVLLILLPGSLIFVLGLYDDLKPLSPYVKLLVQVAAAVLLYAGGFQILSLPLLFGAHHLGWLAALPLTIFWVVLITNAFNLLDGLDGLTAGSAFFSTVTVFVVASINQNHLISILTIILAGALLGFLRFNFNPATIFLGDCGSLFLGFMLSALALAGAHKSPTIVAVAIPLVAFGLPIVDTGLSVVRRFLSGKPIFSADFEHIHHRLLARGLSQRQAVILLYAVSGIFGLLSLFLLNAGGAAAGLVLVVLGVGILLAVQHLGYHEMFELQRMAQRTMEQKKIIVNNLALRRGADRLAQAKDIPEVCRILEEAFENNDFDGFELQIAASLEKISSRSHGLQVTELKGPSRFVWEKPKTDGQPSPLVGPKWVLRMELAASRPALGVLSVHRAYSDRALLVDVNLLTLRFHTALADALDRILETSLSEKADQPAVRAVGTGR